MNSNDTFDTLDNSNAGSKIGDIGTGALGCADDIVVQSNEPSDLQILKNGSKQNSDSHRCILQHQKSVVVEPELKKSQKRTYTYK